jgi:predicted alpha/beta superfamily hydrolase
MEKIKLIVVLLASLILASCQEEVADPNFVTRFSLTSAVNGATYDIKVALPGDNLSASGHCAVIYVLDGEENFNLVASECEKLSARYNTANVLVVSIGYGRSRDLDYTPTKTSSSMGGAPEFIQFIREELVPRMELDFQADTSRSSRVILGHSFGGLFGAYAFAEDNDLFGNYLLLSPSLWFDNEVTLRMETTRRHALMDRQQLVFMGLGTMENMGKMQAPFEAFFRVLKDHYTNVRLSKNLEEDLGHMGSKNPNIRKGLDFYFQNR